MMPSREFHDTLARNLIAARARGEAIAPPSHAIAVDDGYAVQRQADRMRGGESAGYKIGLTGAGGRAAMGSDAPIAGRLRTDDLLRAPASIAPGRFPYFAEAELVVRIGRTLSAAAAPFDRQDMAAAIDAVFAGIELCVSRYAAEDVPLGALIADNANAALLVIGDRLATGWDERLAAIGVTLTTADGMTVEGSSAAVMGHPLDAVVWLANWLAARGEALEPGFHIATGSCTGITPLAHSDRVIVRFGELGGAQVRIGTREV